MSPTHTVFLTRYIAKLLGATQVTLNRLLLGLGIQSSVIAPSGRGSRRLFSLQDLGTIALAYWLFRIGLRTAAIRNTLAEKKVDRLLKSLKNVERIEAEARKIRFLVTWRVAGRSGKAKQKVKFERNLTDVKRIVQESKQFGIVVVPFGRLLKELAENIKKL